MRLLRVLSLPLHVHTFAFSSMSQHSDSDQGGAASPLAAPAVDNGTTLTTGGILTVASIIVLFIVFASGLSSIQFCLNALDQEPSSPSDRRRRNRSAGSNGGTTRRTRGVDPELLRSLPVTVYRAAAAAKGDEVECAVCLAELEDGEEARFLPRCGHGFHAECIDMWLASHVTCPLCRLTVAKPDDMTLQAPTMAPVPRELANYASNNQLPASVLLGVSDHQHQEPVTSAAPSIDERGTATVQLVIEIPDSTAPTPRDAAKSPGSVSLRSIRRLWSFGRQGAGPSSSSSCSCAGGSERADVKQGLSVTVDIAVAEAQLPSVVAAGTTRGAAA